MDEIRSRQHGAISPWHFHASAAPESQWLPEMPSSHYITQISELRTTRSATLFHQRHVLPCPRFGEQLCLLEPQAPLLLRKPRGESGDRGRQRLRPALKRTASACAARAQTCDSTCAPAIASVRKGCQVPAAAPNVGDPAVRPHPLLSCLLRSQSPQGAPREDRAAHREGAE